MRSFLEISITIEMESLWENTPHLLLAFFLKAPLLLCNVRVRHCYQIVQKNMQDAGEESLKNLIPEF